MKCFRCGYCGQPCNNRGTPQAPWQIAVIEPFVNWDEAEQVHGLCCLEREMYESQVQVTREMALDAGVPEMEGTWINW